MTKPERTRFRLQIAGASFDENQPPVAEAVRGWRVTTRYLDISKDEMKIPADWFFTGKNHRKVGDALLKDEIEGQLEWYVDLEGVGALMRLQEAFEGKVLAVDFGSAAGPTILVLSKKPKE